MEVFPIEVKRRKDVAQIKKDIARNTKELFAQKGYSATSMEDICTINNRSKGSIYYHFKSKEELFMYLIKLNNEDWMDAWLDKESGYKTAIDKLYGLADHYVDDLANPLNHAINEFVSGQVVSQEMLDEMLSLIRIPYATYESIITKGMEDGELKPDDPQDVMHIIYGLFSGLTTLYYEKDLTDIRRIYHKGMASLLAGIQQG
ncbi:TetR family transcriptional regulator [Paenibacillus amylolyticus]|uniref:TetR/AcrR family transcriptional regulator n=1 Tax=Paenibacillus TaxID=44249 RepID=UPI0003E2219A|nr:MULTISPECIES: TetR/AcrR family transcriptional regulator [Paenibacillus]ETT29511.1 transcriptional regulator, TetR family protein [Paenibacillus sp. FSL R5-192]ETT44807.1 transcriptional regulator, TetR family protein [Paenibacillus sp. FSL H7-689]OME98436.1 TetR family transcriptional regulator [Paenibacillus amylolyticus]